MAYSAITAVVSHEIVNDGNAILITDDTVYRTPPTTPTRAQCYVNFLVQQINGDTVTDITPNYVSTSVTSILVPITADGWYRITMTITNIPPATDAVPTFSTQAVQNLLVTNRYCNCYSNKIYNAFQNSICGCENVKMVYQLLLLDAQFQGITYMVSKNDMNSANQALERIMLECQALDCDCGC
jgi:hypothetical protein